VHKILQANSKHIWHHLTLQFHCPNISSRTPNRGISLARQLFTARLASPSQFHHVPPSRVVRRTATLAASEGCFILIPPPFGIKRSGLKGQDEKNLDIMARPAGNNDSLAWENDMMI